MSDLRISGVGFALFCLWMAACSESTAEPMTVPSKIFVNDVSNFEGNNLLFEIRLDKAADEDVVVDYEIIGVTASVGTDFAEQQDQSIVIPAGQDRGLIVVSTLNDSENEIQERLELRLINATGAIIQDDSAYGNIKDNNDSDVDNLNGYISSLSHFGYDLIWSDEFDEAIDETSYTFEIGDGCPNVCGWGNNELQSYSNGTENAFVRDGSLVLKAIEDPINGYTSARIITKGKREFMFGRIDIRAKLPEGQGIWPALWMLGANIDEVGWPNCGEIDIMELVGHNPDEVHGTAHWGPQGGGSTFVTGTKGLQQKYSENFHVFTLLWERDCLKWYMDEVLFHTIVPANVTNTAFPFNAPFFFIFNIAVGGNWPGNPDKSTAFPQEMEIDYIRVFQEN